MPVGRPGAQRVTGRSRSGIYAGDPGLRLYRRCRERPGCQPRCGRAELRRLRAQAAGSHPGQPAGRYRARPCPARLRAHRAAVPGSVRRPAGQPPSRPGRPLAAGTQRRLLHHRLVRPRGERGGRGGVAARRSGPAALPVRRVLPGPGGRRPAAAGRRPGRHARPGGGGRRADRGRPAQGDRPRRPAHHPADLDHRLAPATVGRAGLRAGPGGPAGHRRPLAGRRRGAGQHGRCLAEPLHRGRRAEHGRLLQLPAAAAAAANRVRGQRAGHQRPDPGRLGGRGRGRAAGHHLLPRRRVRPGGRVRHRAGGCRLGAVPAVARVPAYVHHPAGRARGLGRRGRLPCQRRYHRRPGP